MIQALPFKVLWFARRFGWAELFLKPWRMAIAPWKIPHLPQQRFVFRDQVLHTFHHPYNFTWAGERLIEVAIAKSLLPTFPGARVLEVGNVLSHYFPTTHTVVDKYEKAPGVINSDIVDYRTTESYDLILSISTFEHLGFEQHDCPLGSGRKIQNAIAHCRSMLSPYGRMFITVPTGYNPELDLMIHNDGLGAIRLDAYRRTGFSLWEPCHLSETVAHPYRCKYPYANSLVVSEFAK